MKNRRRRIGGCSHYVHAPAETVFPLLCPVREYEWIEWWRGELLYADSGLAELDCVFQSQVFEEIGLETWTCSRYEPPRRIEYVRISPATVIRLELCLSPAATGTRVAATLVVTAVSDAGDALVAGFAPDFAERNFRPALIMLDHYVRTGNMLPGAEAVALAAAG